ncbi:hypothetical protein Anapl_17116 [Anas platyrhynchos]|uniref:Uncharacterized protein n=1 Tax=Anas platyrhynchos TaxID=8839 RepID=R0LDX7_ANAPL|nr:hypothetical protein Anapl_17116 [Anas platyrhynchos]
MLESFSSSLAVQGLIGNTFWIKLNIETTIDLVRSDRESANSGSKQKFMRTLRKFSEMPEVSRNELLAGISRQNVQCVFKYNGDVLCRSPAKWLIAGS